eukprot:TRINITY_DN14588_c0_g1_i2.p1 TRINITY_DN14588_c0_g1~~TRINITY_DN14588_c0_g1_i2.p1  ORF type:complete len:479 (-),score=152.35 TRINITY_DN14588_c0_g1_i2:179-1615(-)
MLHACQFCNRWLQPPSRWIPCELESKELLAICLKKLRGLKEVRLVDASFVWTEPHSKRIKTKLTIQKEVLAGTILQQMFIVEFVVQNQACEQCQRVLTGHETWHSCVQARQKVAHKRTFYYLEQLILKHKYDADVLKVKQMPDGLDFFFAHRSQGQKLIEFLGNWSPLRKSESKELVSQDLKSNTYDYKYSFIVEIAPICKDDLLFLPPKLCNFLGGCSPLQVCTKVGATLHLMDPWALKICEINRDQYFRHEFNPLLSAARLVEFTIMDVIPLGEETNKWALAELELVRSDDLGTDTIWHTRTHLGRVLQPGDLALGYDLKSAAINPNDLPGLDKYGELPDAIVVRKHYPNRKKSKRAWKLRELKKDDTDDAGNGKQLSAKQAAQAAEDEAMEYESFLQDLEGDREMRDQIDIFRDPDYVAPVETGMEEDEEDEEQAPEVGLDELIDGLDALGMSEDPANMFGALGEMADEVDDSDL